MIRNVTLRLALIASIVMGILPGTFTLADTVYLWTDDQGIRHFSDQAPASPGSGSRVLQLNSVPVTGGTGLRPGELQALRELQQRARQQQQRSQATRQRNDHKRTLQQQRCTDHRKKLHSARGKDAFKQHSRYLRTHCW